MAVGTASRAWPRGALSAASSLLPRLRVMQGVLVPVKSFAEAKLRLAGVLDHATRRALARRLATVVVGAAREFPCYVACDDEEVANWAIEQGAQVLWTPGLGLSGAVNAASAQLAQLGISLVIVAHGDLPLVQSFVGFAKEGEITLAPDRHGDGTNVAAVPTTAGFRFAYGPGSFRRHRLEAVRLGLRLRTVHDWQLACDVDVPADLAFVDPILQDLAQSTAESRSFS